MEALRIALLGGRKTNTLILDSWKEVNSAWFETFKVFSDGLELHGNKCRASLRYLPLVLLSLVLLSVEGSFFQACFYLVEDLIASG